MTFGEKIKEARLAMNLSQTELAQLTGISERSLYTYEQLGTLPRKNNIRKLAELFPNVVTEMKDENGKLKLGINFELLKQELSDDVVDGEECYEFTWVGKRAAMVEANKPILKTLRPCMDESKNWESTENIYIEGDNLDALKLLQESYLNSVKMIYIDIKAPRLIQFNYSSADFAA